MLTEYTTYTCQPVFASVIDSNVDNQLSTTGKVSILLKS